MIVLGLDISTTNVGVSLLDSGDGQNDLLIESIGMPIGKVKGLYAKSCVIKKELEQIAKTHRPDFIAIEAALKSFQKRRSSAQTLMTLSRFNGIISYIAKEVFSCPVVQINVNQARKILGIKIDKKSSTGVKDQVLMWTMKHDITENFVWPTKSLKSGPRKGAVVFEDFCYDIADSIVIALAGLKSVKTEDLDDTLV